MRFQDFSLVTVPSSKGVGLDPRRPARPGPPGPRRPLGPSLGDDWPPDWGSEKKTKSNNWKAKNRETREKMIERQSNREIYKRVKRGKRVQLYRLIEIRSNLSSLCLQICGMLLWFKKSQTLVQKCPISANEFGKKHQSNIATEIWLILANWILEIFLICLVLVMYKTNFLNDIKKHGVGLSDLSRQEGTKKYKWHELQNFLILSTVVFWFKQGVGKSKFLA